MFLIQKIALEAHVLIASILVPILHVVVTVRASARAIPIGAFSKGISLRNPNENA
mgnify:CR=1 FL=1